MNVPNVKTVQELAFEVAHLATDALAEKKRENESSGYVSTTFYGSALSGTLRRRSMDLTRALAKMRRAS